MTRKIEGDYDITKETMALKTCSIDPTVTIVYEVTQTKYVRTTGFELITKACMKDGWADYRGRREAVKYHMNYHYKIPIPVVPAVGLWFFPTHGAKNQDNIWINPDMIDACFEGELPGTTMMTLRNQETIVVLLQVETLHALYIKALRSQARLNDNDPFRFV